MTIKDKNVQSLESVGEANEGINTDNTNKDNVDNNDVTNNGNLEKENWSRYLAEQ